MDKYTQLGRKKSSFSRELLLAHFVLNEKYTCQAANKKKNVCVTKDEYVAGLKFEKLLSLSSFEFHALNRIICYLMVYYKPSGHSVSYKIPLRSCGNSIIRKPDFTAYLFS